MSSPCRAEEQRLPRCLHVRAEVDDQSADQVRRHGDGPLAGLALGVADEDLPISARHAAPHVDEPLLDVHVVAPQLREFAEPEPAPAASRTMVR